MGIIPKKEVGFLTDETIRTGVDDLLDLLKRVNKIGLTDAAKQLGVSAPLLQSWVDFLVEEEIIGIEYKFTKPIIYLNKPHEIKKAKIEEEGLGLEAYKEDFRRRASQKNIPQGKLSFLWRNHVGAALNRKRDFFYREAKRRNLANVDNLWNSYMQKLLSK